jgi:outer membrane protein assembly factor BamB
LKRPILPIVIFPLLVASGAPASTDGPQPAVPAEPYPLSPEMVLLEKDAASEDYRKLLRSESKNVNVLDAEWKRVGVPDGPEGFAEAHGGAGRVQADPALAAALERRKEIAARFLSILREEYAFRERKAPFDEGARAPPGATAEATAGPEITIEPILPAPGSERQWPRWRGPSGMGLSDEKGLPVRWSPTENVAWKTELPGAGNSSPVIWGEQIFLTTAFDQGRRRSLACVSRSGALLWVKDAPATAPEGRVIAKNGYASATPAVDGERVVAFFGNGGLVAFDLEGKVLWQYPLPPFDAMHGTGASPVIYGDLVVLFQEQSSKPSMGLAVDKRTGERRWVVEREPALGWCTPLALRIAGRDQLVYGASNTVVAYDPATGAEIWKCGGPTHEVIPTVVAGHGLVFCASGRSGPMLAVRPAGTGDLSKTGLVWRAPRGAPHVPSPVLAGEFLYQVNDLGIVTCFRARTGEVLFQKRLGGTYSASPVAADGKIYFTSEEGDTTVMRPGPDLDILSVNPLGETTLASAAVLGGQFFIRTAKQLWAIGQRAGALPRELPRALTEGSP